MSWLRWGYILPPSLHNPFYQEDSESDMEYTYISRKRKRVHQHHQNCQQVKMKLKPPTKRIAISSNNITIIITSPEVNMTKVSPIYIQREISSIIPPTTKIIAKANSLHITLQEHLAKQLQRQRNRQILSRYPDRTKKQPSEE